MIIRSLQNHISSRLDGKKAVIILGPRQSGKTTLIKSIAIKSESDHLYVNADEPVVRNLWRPDNISTVLQIIGTKKLVLIDEAQRLEDVGLLVKIIVDRGLDIQFIITGSSALEIANQTFEPMTGRYREYRLLPVSTEELILHSGLMEMIEELPQRMIYGSYPEVIVEKQQAEEVLRHITQSYLYKDILALTGVRKPLVLDRLLKALAWQTGSQVSFQELSRTVGVDVKTVDRYITLLEQSFVIFSLTSFSRNLRNELIRSKKIYFYDNGIRNAIIQNFSPITLRNDIGALWENFLIAERIKFLHNHQLKVNSFFWRTHSQQEIDYIEEYNSVLNAFEFKFNPAKTAKISSAFLQAYHPTETKVIHSENFWEWLTTTPGHINPFSTSDQ